MSLPETIQRMYQELADRYDRQNEPRLRDIFLLLAADTAFAAGRSDDAEILRRRMVAMNPNSLLRPFPTFAAAMQSLDIQDYLEDLRRQFPPEEVERRVLHVRANPLGAPASGTRTLSQKDTQEVIPPTARTVNMPAPKNLPPKKRSPYEEFVASQAAEEDSAGWTSSLTMFWLFLLGLVGVALTFWTLVRPLLDPA